MFFRALLPKLIMVYQDDFFTPGMRPSLASSRKQIRHTPKSRIKPFLRPQRKQRLTTRDENFGFLFALAITDVFAIFSVNKIKSLEKSLSRHTSK